MYQLDITGIFGPLQGPPSYQILKCLKIVCIVAVVGSDVAAAYLLRIRQARYSFIRRAPPLHYFVLRNKCQGWSVTLESSLHQSTVYLCFVQYLVHTVQSVAFDLCLNT